MKKMLRWGSGLLLLVLMLAALLILPVNASAVPVLNPKSAAVVFEGAVEYAIYFTVTDGENISMDDMGLVTYRTKPEVGTIEDAYRVIPGADYDPSSGRYLVYTGDIPAMRLGDDLYFKVYARLEDGSYVYSKLLDYSILDYAHNALTKDQYSPEFKNLMSELLNYASAAQIYFNHQPDTLANRVLETGGHLYGDTWTVVTKPTLTTPGVEQSVCTLCKGAPLTREIPCLTVSNLAVTSQPAKTAYYNGETFDSTGMVITATLSDGSTTVITDYTLNKTKLTPADTNVTVSYGGKSVSVAVAVSAYEKIGVAQLSKISDGTLMAVEGYYVGVSEEGPSVDRELLLKDLTTDDVIAVRNVPYGSFPNYGYAKGDRVVFLASVHTDGTVNTPNKRYLDFSGENGTLETTIVSRGNEVTYNMDHVITVSSWTQMQELFAVGNIPDYAYIRLEGAIFCNRYEGSDGVTVSRVHMNETATGVSGIRCDGSRTVSFRDNIMEANLGQNWMDLFFDELPVSGQYPGTRVTGSVTAIYTGGNNYYYQLTILDESWVYLEECNNTEAVVLVANSYFRQGTQIQYDQSNRRRNLNVTPEAATAETTVYLDCSSYVNAVYRTTFGVNVMNNDEVPSTAKFAEYCARGGSDVIGYWVNADYTTANQIKNLLSQVRGQLQIGDLLIYRHGTEADPAGHVYIYVGNDMFLHCTGSSYSYANVPSESRDKATVAEKTGGAIQQLHLDEVFVNTESNRYLFMATAEDTVTCFGIIRPLNRGLTVTQQTRDRMRYRGLTTELSVDAGQYTSVQNGQILTYTLNLTNPSVSRVNEVPVSITLPQGTVLSSAGDMTFADGILTWVGKVNAGETVTLTWSVQVNAAAGDCIVTEGYLDTITLNSLTNTVSGYTDAQLSQVVSKANALAGSSFANPMDFVNQVYTSAVGTDPLGNYTAKEVIKMLMDKTNDTLYPDTALTGAVVPDLYGGLDIKDGYMTDLNRTRLVQESYLALGDVVVAEYDGIYEVFIYLGSGKLAKVSSTDGVCRIVTSTGEAYSGTNVFATFIAYDQYVILRPSMFG